MKDHQSSIDVILTNKPKSFQHTTVFESCLSDYHLMISTSLKVKLVCFKIKSHYKKFNQTDFLTDAQKESFNCNEGNGNENYNKLVNTFRKIVDKHAPMKRKTLRGNQGPFMTRELRKAIYNRSRLKNKQNKHPTNENRIKYKKQRNKCVSLRKKAMKSYFKTTVQVMA